MARWLGKTLNFSCPHCLKALTVGYRGQIFGTPIIVESGQQTDSIVAPSKRSLAMKAIRPPYTVMLEALLVGQSITIAPNRLAWFGWSCAPWLRRHPHVVLSEEKLEDGSIIFTREEDAK